MSKSQSKRSLGNTPLRRDSAATGVSLNGTLHEQDWLFWPTSTAFPLTLWWIALSHFQVSQCRAWNAESQAGGSLLDAGWKVFIDALPKDTAEKERKVFRKLELLFILRHQNLWHHCWHVVEPTGSGNAHLRGLRCWKPRFQGSD